MKITTVSLSRTIPTGPYMNDKIGIEATLEQGESESDALHALSSRIERWHKEANPHLYQSAQVQVGVAFHDSEGKRTGLVMQEPIPIISKDSERLEIAIDNASTLEELKAIKEANPVMPHPVLVLYNKKLEELAK